MEVINEKKNRDRVVAGLSGGPMFLNGNKAPAMRVIDGTPDTVAEKAQNNPIAAPTPIDPWVYRNQAVKFKKR